MIPFDRESFVSISLLGVSKFSHRKYYPEAVSRLSRNFLANITASKVRALVLLSSEANHRYRATFAFRRIRRPLVYDTISSLHDAESEFLRFYETSSSFHWSNIADLIHLTRLQRHCEGWVFRKGNNGRLIRLNRFHRSGEIKSTKANARARSFGIGLVNFIKTDNIVSMQRVCRGGRGSNQGSGTSN